MFLIIWGKKSIIEGTSQRLISAYTSSLFQRDSHITDQSKPTHCKFSENVYSHARYFLKDLQLIASLVYCFTFINVCTLFK